MSQTKLTVVILAAGIGSRLGDLTKDKPKALQIVDGKPLIAYQLAWARSLKAERTIVVGGYLIEQLREAVMAHMPEAMVVENPNFRTTQRMSSLLYAKDHIIGDMLAFDGDYIYSNTIADAIRARDYTQIAVHSSTERSPYTEQDVIVRINDNRTLIDMYKTKGTVPLENARQEYFNSLLYCPEKFLAEYWTTAEAVIVKSDTGLVHLEDVILEYSKSNPVDVVNLGTPLWMEIDNPKELEAAERFVADHRDIVPL